MLEEVTRPHFFPGQLLDYRDFNRLSLQGDKIAALMGSQLLAGGGILLQSLREFEPAFSEGLTVVVRPGMAILPNGQTLVLNSDLAIDLSQFAVKGGMRAIVSIRNKATAEDPYQDPEDPSIQGFQTHRLVPELVVSTEEVPADSLELFRVILDDEAHSLRLPLREEEWIGGELSAKAGVAVIDTRFRKRILPLTFLPLDFPQLMKIRAALYRIEEAHNRLQRIFLFDDIQGTSGYLSQLHAEVLSVPYQALKVAFLLATFSDRLAIFLEALSRKCPADQANFNRELFLEISSMLGEARERQALPRALPFQLVLKLSDKLDDLARFAEKQFTLINALEQALIDLRDRAVDFPEKTTLAGHVFRRVDYVQATDKQRVVFQSESSQVRKLQTRYRSGDLVGRTGVFVREGKIQLDFQILHPDAPAIVWFPQYIRRKGAKLEYRINGKTLLQDFAPEGDDNVWKNRGLIIQPEALIAQNNRLTIRIDEADLDYGFFEAAIYQPLNAQGVFQ